MSLSLNGSGGIFGLDQGLNVTGVGTFQTLNVTGNLTVDGVLTYDDVTNIDSIGVITARSGVHFGTAASGTLVNGNSAGIGIGIDNPICKLVVNSGTTNLATQIVSDDAEVFLAFKDGDSAGNQQVQIGGVGNNFVAYAGGNERLRITGIGSVGIGIDDPQTVLHISDNTVANARITISKFDTFRNNFIGLDNQSDELVIAVDDDDQGTSSSLRLKVDGAAVGTFTGTGVSFAQDLTLPGQERFIAYKTGRSGW